MELAAPATDQNGFCSLLTILRDTGHFMGPEYELFFKRSEKRDVFLYPGHKKSLLGMELDCTNVVFFCKHLPVCVWFFVFLRSCWMWSGRWPGGSIFEDGSIKLFAGRRLREKIAPINRKPHHTEEGMLPTCLLGIVNICWLLRKRKCKMVWEETKRQEVLTRAIRDQSLALAALPCQGTRWLLHGIFFPFSTSRTIYQ